MLVDVTRCLSPDAYHHATERYWRKMLSSRSRKGKVTWESFWKLKERYPLQKPKLVLPYGKLQAIAVL